MRLGLIAGQKQSHWKIIIIQYRLFHKRILRILPGIQSQRNTNTGGGAFQSAHECNTMNIKPALAKKSIE